MLFIGYDQDTTSLDSNGSTTVYTTTYKCMIAAEADGADPEGNTDQIVVYAEGSGDDPDKILFEVYGSLVGADLNDGRARGMHILDSGLDIIAFRNGESFDLTLHIFRLPENP